MPSSHRFFPALLAALLGAVSLSGQVSIDTVAVGNSSNAADPTTGYGAVSYDYRIGLYEVTNAQYATFLNAVAATDPYALYNPNLGSSQFGGINRSGGSGSYTYAAKSGYENTPVGYVSFWDAARFTNWLHNGQGAGSTETGTYTLNGVANPANSSVLRNSGAQVWIPSEDEWYKAAYFDPTLNGGAGGYYLFPTRSNTLGGNTPFTLANGANYYDGDYTIYTGSNNGATPVGTYLNAGSYFGTVDQGGNAWERNETIISSSSRSIRGGGWFDSDTTDYLRASFRGEIDPVFEYYDIGFRVASLTLVPEPSAYAALVGLGALVVSLRRRRRA